MQAGLQASKATIEDLFDPTLLAPASGYVKRVKGKGKKEVESPIDNSLKGIHDYFTAPNIRNKCRSLLFYLFMFCNCCAVYMPKEEVESSNVGVFDL